MSYPGHLLKESYLSAEMQSVYSEVPGEWAMNKVFNTNDRIYKDQSYNGDHDDNRCIDFLSSLDI